MRKLLDRLQQHKLKRPQYAPHRWSVPAYGKRLQMTPYLYESNIIHKNATNRIQSIVGTMLYYAWSVGPIILRKIHGFLRVQSRTTQDTEEKQEYY